MNVRGLPESEIQTCAYEGTELEVKTQVESTVDCVSETHAIDIEATQNWAEAIRQSLEYGHETASAPKVLLF